MQHTGLLVRAWCVLFVCVPVFPWEGHGGLFSCIFPCGPVKKKELKKIFHFMQGTPLFD